MVLDLRDQAFYDVRRLSDIYDSYLASRVGSVWTSLQLTRWPARPAPTNVYRVFKTTALESEFDCTRQVHSKLRIPVWPEGFHFEDHYHHG